MKRLIIFDMDGTLYSFREGSFQKSKLKQQIRQNAKEFIRNKLQVDEKKLASIWKHIENHYGESISIALEKEFGIDRYEYFTKVWDIDPQSFIHKIPNLRETLEDIGRDYDYLLISDAPKIWIEHVLAALGVKDLFTEKIYSGEGDNRKGSNNAFSPILEKVGYFPEDCIVVGDQENTDILPAKLLGMKAVLISADFQETEADASINNIRFLKKALLQINSLFAVK